MSAAFDEYLEQLLAHEPEWRLARAVVAPLRDARVEALRVLEAQLLDAAVDVRDTGVALAKLGWWGEELELGVQGRARHPVSRFAAEHGLLESGRVAALIAGAGAIAELESPADVDALLAPFSRFAGACALAAPLAADQAAGAAMLVMRLRRWPVFANPVRARVPLALLARHGVGRDALATAAGAEVLGSIATTLRERIEAVPTAGRGALEAARLACGAHVARRLARDPARATGGGTRARALPLMWDLWWIGRRERLY